MLKLDLGANAVSPPGYVPMGHFHGSEIYPLPSTVEDGSVDEIRASHVLEHFPTGEIANVLKHWAAKLKPGGVMKVAVPNFEWIAQAYLDGQNVPIEGYTMGGQTDGDDFHKSLFDRRTLAELLRDAGLVDIGPWDSDAEDCSRLPVSLNVRAVKPVPVVPGSFKIAAIMSMPRLGFTDNFVSAQAALTRRGIELRPFVGAYWGQCLERGFDWVIGDGFDAVLTLDYDTIFTAQNVDTLIRLMMLHPEADAICPIQAARGWTGPLLTLKLAEGLSHSKLPRTYFDGDMVPLRTGHFGCTLIRTAAVKEMPRPLFLAKPAADGTWGDGHVDEDIYFWRQWEAAGKTLLNANRVVVGHLELMIKWPTRNLKTIHQRVAEFWNDGPPEGVWK